MKAIVLAISVLLPSVALGAVNLTISRGMELIAVNGIPVDSPLFLGKIDNQQLPNGENQIAVRATQLVKENNNTKKFTSQVSVLTFEGNNQTIDIQAPMLKTWDKGVAFDNNPNWSLSSDGSPIHYRLGNLSAMTNMSVLRNFGEELEAFNRSNQPAALPRLIGATLGRAKDNYMLATPAAPTRVLSEATTPAATLTVTPPEPQQRSHQQEIKTLFNQMTPSEKRDFISWAAQQL